MTQKSTNDRALRIYHQVLGLERLHYGIWQDEEELSLHNLKQAQQRYEDFIMGRIPEDVHRILDVGCGTGAMLAALKQKEFDAEGLTPDDHQIRFLAAKGLSPCHHTRFEDFVPPRKYDCIIMSESAQYIPLPALFTKAQAALRPNGYLMVCDYFLRDGAEGIMAKSGHPLNLFMAAGEASGFRRLQSEDITAETARTLELATDIAHKAILAVDIATEKIRKRHPLATRLLMRLFRRKIRSASRELTLIDADRFKAHKYYQFILFQSA
jgi:MPBQ/MSBQ methyltransferase